MITLRRKVPAAVRAVTTDERRLGWGVTADGLALVATPSGLHVGSDLLAWTRVEKATWARPELVLREVSLREGQGAVHRYRLEQEHKLTGAVRTCVTSSVGWSEVRRLSGGGKVRVVGRRVPGQDAMLWQAVHLEGTDPDDPAVRDEVLALVARLRATLG